MAKSWQKMNVQLLPNTGKNNCISVLQDLLMKVHELNNVLLILTRYFLSLMDTRKVDIRNKTTDLAFVDGFFPKCRERVVCWNVNRNVIPVRNTILPEY